MGIADKARNKAEELAGKAKAAVGDATDNRDLEAEGRAEESEAEAKQATDNITDALREAGTAMKGDDQRPV
jgi:uncharacterized protein YjbJ (UPF0337 family)